MERRIMDITKNILAASLALAIVFVAHAEGALVKNGDKIVFMGDSITHYGVERSHGYVNLTVQGGPSGPGQSAQSRFRKHTRAGGGTRIRF